MTILISNLLKDYNELNKKNTLLNENGRVMTHEELEEHSNQFAHFLRKKGVKKNDRIVLMMHLNIDTIITIMGIIKSGAIYVPVDKAQPDHFVKRIMEDVTPRFVICDGQFTAKFQMSVEEEIIVYERESRFFDYLKEDNSEVKSELISKDIVYIAYTSGTTGIPKGVMISHENVMTFIRSVTKNKRFHNQKTRSLCRTPISFDPFLTEVLPSMISGGQVYIQERDVSFRKFISFVAKNRITNLGCGPSLLFLMADNLPFLAKYDLSSLKEIYIGYEKCPVSVIKKMQKEYPNICFINGYGTTETFASSTFYEIPKLVNETNIPIGLAVENEQLLVLNQEGNNCEIEEVGELVIRGNSVFNGYWKNQEETKRRLVINPLFPESNELVYFTGDLVFVDSKNRIYFVGRKDEQIKINGHRVELGEVQYTIESYEDIKECCVIFSEGVLSCFFNTYSSEVKIEESLKQYCKQRLASYKIPHEWVRVEKIPRNINGKIKKDELQKLTKASCIL